MARPSIVPIALTLDDRTGYTLWAPPWEEDGEEWQAFLGSTVEDGPEDRPASSVHVFPTLQALAAFCRTAKDHDLADHPVWPVVTTLGPDDLAPDDDHRFDFDGVYDIAAEDPDRWAVDELAATFDIAGRLAECCDVDDEDEDSDDDESEGEFEALAELMSRPETALLGAGINAFLGRTGEEAWIRLGTAVDELWEDVVEEINDHLDWTGGGTVALTDYPSASEESARERLTDDEVIAPEDVVGDDATVAAGATTTAATATSAAAGGVSTIRRGSRITASAAEVAAAGEFWEAVGILPVEVVVPEGAGLTLRCYVEDEARFLGRDGEVYLFPTPTDLARFCAGDEEHDLTEIASWPEVVATDQAPLPADEDRYDLTELREVLSEVADGAAGLARHSALLQPVEGVRDLAEYAGLDRVEQLLSGTTPLGKAIARSEREPDATLTAADAAVLLPEWEQVVREIGNALVFRD